MWISLLLSISASLFLIAVIQPIANMAISWLRLKYYKNQGMPTYYSPIIGHLGMYSKKHVDNHKRRSTEYVKKLPSVKGDKGIMATNFLFNGTKNGVLVYGSDLIKEFLVKEDKFEKARVLAKGKYNRFGLFFLDGDEMMKQKSLFLKLFRYEGIEEIVQSLCQIIQDSFNHFNLVKGIGKEPIRANLNDLFPTIMKKITNIIMFGKETFEAGSPEEELHDQFFQLGETFKEFGKNPFLIMWPNLMARLGLSSVAARLDNINKRQIDLI